MSLYSLFKNLYPYVRSYRWLIAATLLLTLIGSLTAQVNALVLQYTVDEVNKLVEAGKDVVEGTEILAFISVILLGKEILSAFITFGQRFFGERLRIMVSKDLAQAVIERILTYKMAFFTSADNEAGKLQTRIDRGVESLTRLVQNFFIDILPLFAGSIIALVLMFNANFYVGLTALCIVPVYFYITYRQAG